VTWNTSTNATSKVPLRADAGAGAGHGDLRRVTPHPRRAPHRPDAGSSYFYDVESVALNGNSTRDDRGGEHYRFTAKGAGDVLLLVGEVGFPRLATWESALQAARYDYDVWSGPLADAAPLGDATSGLRSYRAVLWQAGFETYPPLSDSQRQVVDRLPGRPVAGWPWSGTTSPGPSATDLTGVHGGAAELAGLDAEDGVAGGPDHLGVAGRLRRRSHFRALRRRNRLRAVPHRRCRG